MNRESQARLVLDSVGQTAAEDKKPRFDGVDLLRGFSIMAVILLHAKIRLSAPGHGIGAGLPSWLYNLLFANGTNGVTVFFAISGFLITFTSIGRFGALAKIRPLVFYRFRFARIAPLLLLLLAVLSALHLAGVAGFYINPKRTDLAHALFAALTFHLNWLEAARGYLPPNWDVLWSLSIEEMFYLFFPLACFALLRWRGGTLAFVFLLALLVVAGPFARTVWTGNEIWLEKSYLGNMDAIAMGCMTALLIQFLLNHPALPLLKSRRALLLLEIAGSALILLVAIWPRWSWLRYLGRHGLDVTILPLGACLFIIGSVCSGRRGGRVGAPLRWFGRHSYEIYLTHEFVVVWGAALYAAVLSGPIAAWIAGIIAFSAVLGAGAAYGFSEPLNRLLRGGSAMRPHPALGETAGQ